ncbi:MAG: NAD-dependent epimerase/dehydratase family protein [Candidatus Aminicenantes bacterium]|nr:NAD-dependent epimerase/dehydratase family protein [Candidatus Aminicenantes bacterium]
MKVLVTGAAGFIGSHLCRALADQGHEVTGVDAFTDFYPRWMKESALKPLISRPGFTFLSEDLNRIDLRALLDGQDAVFHLAAQAGVRQSWGRTFETYVLNNIQNTQRLLEAARDIRPAKIVYASSSSIYGLTPDLPMKETSPVAPLSPYGVTKLAAEHLCTLYQKNYGLPVVSLRFFTVYGPGQRPDMAFHRFLKSVLEDREIVVYGDGSQTRDFTYVDDIVAACLSALVSGRDGEVYNVGGGHRERLSNVISLLEDVCGRPIRRRFEDKQKGDVPDTLADIDKARRDLGYSPRAGLRDGLSREWEWIRTLYDSGRHATQE